MEDANQYSSVRPFIANMKIDAVPVGFQFGVPFAPIYKAPNQGVSVSHEFLALPILSFNTDVNPEAYGNAS